jgi:hypothetical protein
VKRAKIIAGVVAAAGMLFAAGIIAASTPGAAAAKPAPTGPHWVTQHYENVVVPAFSRGATYTIGCPAGEVLQQIQSSATLSWVYGGLPATGTNSSLNDLVSPLGIVGQPTVPTSALAYAAESGSQEQDTTVTWTIALLCQATS